MTAPTASMPATLTLFCWCPRHPRVKGTNRLDELRWKSFFKVFEADTTAMQLILLTSPKGSTTVALRMDTRSLLNRTISGESWGHLSSRLCTRVINKCRTYAQKRTVTIKYQRGIIQRFHQKPDLFRWLPKLTIC